MTMRNHINLIESLQNNPLTNKKSMTLSEYIQKQDNLSEEKKMALQSLAEEQEEDPYFVKIDSMYQNYLKQGQKQVENISTALKILTKVLRIKENAVENFKSTRSLKSFEDASSEINEISSVFSDYIMKIDELSSQFYDISNPNDNPNY